MRTPILILVLLLAGVSAAGAQRRAELLLSDAPAPEGRRCSILRRLSAQQMAALDTAALRQALAAEAGLPGEGDVLYSVRLDTEGGVEWVRPIGTTLPAEAEARVQALVRAHLRAPKAGEPWSFRAKVALGASPELRIGHSEVCPVAVAERASGRGVMSRVTTGAELAEMRRAGPVRVRVLVGPDGAIRDVRLDQSSGSRIRDEISLDAARENVYLPALVDGFAAEGWFEHRTRTSPR